MDVVKELYAMGYGDVVNVFTAAMNGADDVDLETFEEILLEMPKILDYLSERTADDEYDLAEVFTEWIEGAATT